MTVQTEVQRLMTVQTEVQRTEVQRLRRVSEASKGFRGFYREI